MSTDAAWTGRRDCKAAATARALSPSDARAARRGAAVWVFAIGQIPWILDAEAAGAGTGRHHALLERCEGATRGAVAAAALVLDAPGPVDFGGSRANIDRSQGRERKQGEGGAHHHHGYPPIEPAD